MYNKEEVLKKVDILYNMWKKGSLGGEVMPEDTKRDMFLREIETQIEWELDMLIPSVDRDILTERIRL